MEKTEEYSEIWLKSIIIREISDYRDIPAEELLLLQMKTGISRKVFKVSAKGDQAPSLLVRYMNPNLPYQVEYRIIKELNNLGLFPKVYFQNDEIRIEEFMENTRVIKSKEINIESIRRKLAIQLGLIHKCKFDFLDKNSTILANLDSNVAYFLKQSSEMIDNPDKFDQNDIEIVTNAQDLVEDLDYVKAIFGRYHLVFSHNDIWVGNILLNTSENEIEPCFIDYEVSNYNFRGYDIGKLLIEPCFTRPKEGSPHFEMDYTLLPTDDEMKDFIAFYLLSNYTDLNKNELYLYLNKQFEEVMLEISQLTGRNANDMMNSIFIESVGGIIASNYRLALICLSLGRNFNKEIDIFEFGNVSYFFYQKYKELYNNLINK